MQTAGTLTYYLNYHDTDSEKPYSGALCTQVGLPRKASFVSLDEAREAMYKLNEISPRKFSIYGHISTD